MSLSGWKSLRTSLCFVGSAPAVSTGTEGAGLAAPPGVVSFSQVLPYIFLQFRVFPKPFPSTEWTSPDTVTWLSRGIKKLWVTGAVTP